nr:beta-galactosidase [Candidatus Anammoximicrobium sp.]
MRRATTIVVFGLLVFAIGTSGWPQMLDWTDSRVQTTLKTGWKGLGTIQPRSVSEIDAGQNWALGCETLCRDYIYWDTYKDYVAPLGIKTIRLQGGWAKTEKVPGVYDFAWLDYVIDDALSKGLEIWLETDYGNPIYEGAGTADLGAGFPTSEVGLAAWDRWVEAMATRYKDKVKKWAMWNEPDI